MVAIWAYYWGRPAYVSYFFVSLFCSPLVAIVVLLVEGKDQKVLAERAHKKGNLKKCPYCSEWIQQDAIKCKYCGSIMGQDVQSSKLIVTPLSPPPRPAQRICSRCNNPVPPEDAFCRLCGTPMQRG